MAHINNRGYAVVDTDPNTITALQSNHSIKKAVHNDGREWNYVSTNSSGLRWVLQVPEIDRPQTSNKSGYYYVDSNFDFSILNSDVFACSTLEIREDVDLTGVSIVLIKDMTLFFNGGVLKNYSSIIFNSTKIESKRCLAFDSNGSLSGDIYNEVYPEWFGAEGDGIVKDTDAFNKAISVASTVIVSKNYLIDPITITKRDFTLKGINGALITLDSNGALNSGITTNQPRVRIENIEFKVVGGYLPDFILNIEGGFSSIVSCKMGYDTKSNYVGNGSDIPYNTGCLVIDAPASNCLVENNELYNAEGIGLLNRAGKTRIINNLVRDNILGMHLNYGGLPERGSDLLVQGNQIQDNNAGNPSGFAFQGGDGILSAEQNVNIRYIGNNFINNGEHGLYNHASRCIITGNTAKGNGGSGFKVRADDCTISGNFAESNSSRNAGIEDADYYFQNGVNIVCSNNVSLNANTYGIRFVFINSQSVEGQEKRFIINGNQVYNSANEGLIISGRDSYIVSNNVINGDVVFGSEESGTPIIQDTIISENIFESVYIGKMSTSVFKGNVLDDLTLNQTSNMLILGNKIKNQTAPIGTMGRIKEFSDNKITYTVTQNTNALFLQESNRGNNDGKVFKNNEMTSSGGRLYSASSSGASGNNLVFINNIFTGVQQPLYFWGTGHMIIGNKTADYNPVNNSGNRVGFLGCSHSIISANMGSPSIRSGSTGNTVSGNIPTVVLN